MPRPDEAVPADEATAAGDAARPDPFTAAAAALPDPFTAAAAALPLRDHPSPFP
ncbi:MAG: hypothetical protein HZB46_13480, partial [Solirubrobacterales bacterium]|nr:hypothetical protein [Solirubrobacterales bacterium]